MPALAADKDPSITLYFVQDLGIQTMAPRDGVEGAGLMEAPLQDPQDHQDPLAEEGEVVVALDSQGVMAVVLPLHALLAQTEFPWPNGHLQCL